MYVLSLASTLAKNRSLQPNHSWSPITLTGLIAPVVLVTQQSVGVTNQSLNLALTDPAECSPECRYPTRRSLIERRDVPERVTHLPNHRLVVPLLNRNAIYDHNTTKQHFKQLRSMPGVVPKCTRPAGRKPVYPVCPAKQKAVSPYFGITDLCCSLIHHFCLLVLFRPFLQAYSMSGMIPANIYAESCGAILSLAESGQSTGADSQSLTLTPLFVRAASKTSY